MEENNELIIACKNGDIKTVDRCIAEGTDIFAKDNKGRTALFYAAENGRLDIVKKLIFSLRGTGFAPPRQGFLEIKNNNGENAADIAGKKGHNEIVDLILSEIARMKYFE
ncbi:MAG: ankyrin repeat domain-containing protein [Candidatus Micrarchaeota archaeon]